MFSRGSEDPPSTIYLQFCDFLPFREKMAKKVLKVVQGKGLFLQKK